MDLWHLQRGDSPLIVDVPHCGTYLPPVIAASLSAEARGLPDTDWHVERLYSFVPGLGATLMCATHSRYVVDLNRDPSGTPLYPGADNTEVCPTRTFLGNPVYAEAAPDAAEVDRRIERYWRPYHALLTAEVERVCSRHGFAVLLDGHSILSEVPRFFAGRLPHLNLGTADGASADAALIDRAAEVLRAAEGFSWVRDGRFKGGYITRAFGVPNRGVHALQLEMAQRAYMDERPPPAWDPARAQTLRRVLERLVESLLAWRP